MAEARESSRPPSDPHAPAVRARGPRFASEPQPPRAQLLAATLLGLFLLASGVFLWRRPHGLSRSSSGDVPERQGGDLAPEDAGLQVTVDAGGLWGPVQLSDARVVGCHDRGTRKTLPDDCDRLVGIEQALSRAIERAASCVPQSLPSATIEYVADVSFSRHTLRISLPRAARSVRDRKVISACATAVREGVPASTLDGVGHEHARYQISITATYRSPG